MFNLRWLWYIILVFSTILLVFGFIYGNVWLSMSALLLGIVLKRCDKNHFKSTREKIE